MRQRTQSRASSLTCSQSGPLHTHDARYQYRREHVSTGSQRAATVPGHVLALQDLTEHGRRVVFGEVEGGRARQHVVQHCARRTTTRQYRARCTGARTQAIPHCTALCTRVCTNFSQLTSAQRPHVDFGRVAAGLGEGGGRRVRRGGGGLVEACLVCGCLVHLREGRRERDGKREREGERERKGERM
eukprot:790976-Rhodomonas_salina.2